ncbi:21844_t:CDS:2, partial [Racocetra persica]
YKGYIEIDRKYLKEAEKTLREHFKELDEIEDGDPEMLRDELGEINRFLGRKDYREDNFKISELINELAKEEGKKCGSCDKKIEEDDIVKCQGCKYYFCSNTCWGEGDEDFCQDCLKGDDKSGRQLGSKLLPLSKNGGRNEGQAQQKEATSLKMD